jgi:DNA polymerase III epsilon subunit family exonuclease
MFERGGIVQHARDAELLLSAGILKLPVEEAPIAVIDFETTGLSAGYDRVVEVSIVRVEPGGGRRTLVFDSLVNPRRRVSATEIHGITDAMVTDAPEFKDVWPAVRFALAGCVVTAYNAYFDMRFLEAEAELAGDSVAPPYFCMMYMRSLIGVGSRCRLDAACQEHGIRLHDAHRSARDAMATAELLPVYMSAMRTAGLRTFEDLSQAGSHKYLQSFRFSPLTAATQAKRKEPYPRERAQVRKPGVSSFLSRLSSR